MTYRAYLREERAQRLREFWPTAQPIRVLAAEWGCTIPYISIKAKELGLPSRQLRRMTDPTVFGRGEAHLYFVREAQRRGMSPHRLEALIIKIVSNDRMVDAILDDADQLLVTMHAQPA